MTRPRPILAVIGDPIAHSRSPQMHQGAYAALGLSYRYVAIHVPIGEVAPALDHLRELGYIGVNVTVPHKEDALRWCTDREPFAERVRAAKHPAFGRSRMYQYGWTGLPGHFGGSRAKTADLSLSRGGRIARAIAHVMVGVGWRLKLYNRTRARADEMIKGLGIDVQILDSPDPFGASLILNTTSAGLKYEDIQIPWNRAAQTTFAYDISYGASRPQFLVKAAAQGLRTADGLALLVAQGARSLQWWLGPEYVHRLPQIRAAMREALR